MTKKAKSETVRMRMQPDRKRLFEKAGEVLGVDLTNFLVLAGMEKVARMRATGEKL